MLVLSRKLGEQIVLPHCEVTVTVLGVSRNRVRLGVAAPSGTAVHRREIWSRIVGSAPDKPVHHDQESPLSRVGKRHRQNRGIADANEPEVQATPSAFVY